MSTTGRLKIKILDTCPQCDGAAYLPIGKNEDFKRELYTQYAPCSFCEGSGLAEKYIGLGQLIQLIEAFDVCEPDYKSLAEEKIRSQYIDSLESAGLR